MPLCPESMHVSRHCSQTATYKAAYFTAMFLPVQLKHLLMTENWMKRPYVEVNLRILRSRWHTFERIRKFEDTMLFLRLGVCWVTSCGTSHTRKKLTLFVLPAWRERERERNRESAACIRLHRAPRGALDYI